MNIATPFSRPVYVMAKPAGAMCNLRCDYCYYLEKDNMYAQGSRMMDDVMLEKFVKDYIAAQTMPHVLFTWHGGEPLLRPIAFYERALALQCRYGRGMQVDNCIQTNGTLLTDEWCDFLRRNNFLVGISIDGPADVHDCYRRTAGGADTHARVMQGIRLLEKHGIEWNAMAVVNSLNVKKPVEFYRFFRDMGCHFIQFAPIVERVMQRDDALKLVPGMTIGGEMTKQSVTAKQWGEFLCGVFDEWVRRDVGEYYVQIFDATLANWCGESPGVCTLSAECGNVGVLEWNGDMYSCDHFVFPEYRLGNLGEHTVSDMMRSQCQQRFAAMKRQMLPRECCECKYQFACHGECPKNRFVNDKYGESGKNYLCEGYRRFFNHVAPYMDCMRRLIEEGLSPSEVMKYDVKRLIKTD